MISQRSDQAAPCGIRACCVAGDIHISEFSANGALEGDYIFCMMHGQAFLSSRVSDCEVNRENENAEMVECHVQLLVDFRGHFVNHVYLCENAVPHRPLVFWCGPAEASILGTALRLKNPVRPLTADAMLSLIRSLGGSVEYILIHSRAAETDCFFANVQIAHYEKSLGVDLRPSDAIAIAVRACAPIYVATKLLDRRMQPAEMPRSLT